RLGMLESAARPERRGSRLPPTRARRPEPFFSPLLNYPVTQLPDSPPSLQRAQGEECGNFLTHAGDERVAVFDGDVPGFDGLADADRESHGSDNEAALHHGGASD